MYSAFIEHGAAGHDELRACPFLINGSALGPFSVAGFGHAVSFRVQAVNMLE
jgi:hypothetical protein